MPVPDGFCRSLSDWESQETDHGVEVIKAAARRKREIARSAIV